MNKLLISVLTLLIYSCKTSVDRHKLDPDSQDVYNLALDRTTGSDTFVRYHLKIPPIMPKLPDDKKVDSLERLQFLQWQDRLRSILDTAELFVIVNHKIDTLAKSDISNILETITSNKNNLDYKMDRDTSFNEALRELCNNKLSFDTIDVTKLKTRFNFKIYSDRYFPDDDVRRIGKVRFSKIAFSNQKDKAAIYTSFICGRLCGTGQILFFKKVNGIWKYVRTWEMWVS